MAFDGRGPSETTVRIAREWQKSGAHVRLVGSRARKKPEGLKVTHPAHMGLNWLPYRKVAVPLERAAEEIFIRQTEPSQACHVWPSASTHARKRLRQRGAVLFVEMINCHTAMERELVMAEYQRLGIHETGYIASDMVSKQRADLALADFIFAPNAWVRESLANEDIDHSAIIDTSYGAYARDDIESEMQERNERSARPGRRLTYVFVGNLSIQKGAHTLLRSWNKARVNGDLIIAGDIDPTFSKHFGSLMNTENVFHHGFVASIDKLYASADVFLFPSLTEGGPQVVYEAAAHGLPMIVSPMGGGRLAVDGVNSLVRSPYDESKWVEAIQDVHHDSELRQKLGKNAAVASLAFTWENVARQRLDAIIQRV